MAKQGDFDKARYIATLARVGETALARRAAGGVTRENVQAHLRRDPEFRTSCTEAMARYKAHLGVTIHNRGVNGWMEPRFDKEGNIVGEVWKFSERLLLAQAKRHCPEYRDRVTIDSSKDADLGERLQAEKLTPESRRQLREILKREKALQLGGETDDQVGNPSG